MQQNSKPGISENSLDWSSLGATDRKKRVAPNLNPAPAAQRRTAENVDTSAPSVRAKENAAPQAIGSEERKESLVLAFIKDHKELFIAALAVVAVYLLVAFFRYEYIKPPAGHYIYKVDRLTGKTTALNNGREIPVKPFSD